MALGDITKSEIDRLTLNAGQSKMLSALAISGDVFAVAYQDAANDGQLATFDCDSAGALGSVLGTFEFEADTCFFPHLIHISGTVYAIVYQGPGQDGWIVTITIQNNGTISGTIDSWQFDSLNGQSPRILKIAGTVYAIFCSGGYSGVIGGASYWLKTFNIANDGTITKSFIGSLIQNTFGVEWCRLLRGNGNYFLTCYRNAVSGAVVAETIYITDAGAISSATDTYTIAASATDLDVFSLSTGYFCSIYKVSSDGHLTTFSVDSVGAITAIDTENFHSPATYTPMGVTLTGTMRAIVFRDGVTQNPGYIQTRSIDNEGIINDDLQDSWEFDAGFSGWPQLVRRSGSTWMVIYENGSVGPLDVFTLNVNTPAVYPSDDIARVSSIRHIFRPGMFRMQVNLGAIGFDIDVAETAVRRELDTAIPVARIEPEPLPPRPPIDPDIDWTPYQSPDPFPASDKVTDPIQASTNVSPSSTFWQAVRDLPSPLDLLRRLFGR